MGDGVSPEGLNSFERALDRCANLVRLWGDSAPPGRKSVRQLFAIDGVSMWDIMAVEIALYFLPNALATRHGIPSLRELLLPILRPIKYAFRPRLLQDCCNCETWPKGRTALMSGFSWYLTRDVLLPVAERLQAEKKLFPVIVASEMPGSYSGSVSIQLLSGHVHPHVIEEARRIAEEAKAAASTLFSDRGYQNLFRENGCLIWDKIKDALKTAMLFRAVYGMSAEVSIAKHILQRHRPSIIASIDVADPRTRIYSLLGRSLGIPTLQVQSGQVGHEAAEWKFFQDDLVAAQGLDSQRAFISHGVPQNRIVVTGSPRYDGLSPATPQDRENLRRRFGLSSDTRVVLLASSYHTDYSGTKKTLELSETGRLLRAMKIAVFQATQSQPGIFLIVKPHPMESAEETRSLANGVSNVGFAEKAESITPLIEACDCFMSFGSTATMEAIVLGKPTVCPAFPGWMFSDMYTRSGAVVAPGSEEEVASSMNSIARDGGEEIRGQCEVARQAFLHRMLKDGGHGAVRSIADLMSSMAI